ncbi:MAG: asparagine synthase (glutamine-hydrolyzing) [Bacteroidota bacterium]|nr:asparagine synthase (glutamine-hydrolyzing) [Bacteroidota bacterium]
MCGIAGIIQPGPGSFSKEHLKKMTDTLAHRGPAGEGLWQNAEGRVLLGHRRLAIIDLSEAAAQPMHYLERYTIIHNGEIYNYIELREDLLKKGYSFRTGSDTEVILAAYHHYSDDCVDHFDGMFAFAIWDEQEQELFAARDRFGEKPFFYSFNGSKLIFASEMKALWAAGVERKPNLCMHFNFITIGYTDNPGQPGETFFENVFKLPPASALYFTPSSRELIVEKYWDIDPAYQDKKISDNEAIEQFSYLFSGSIKRRLRSDVAIGTSLSGGLDSSSIAATVSSLTVPSNTESLLQAKPGSSLSSFTAIFPGFDKDESFFAMQAAKQYGLEPRTIEITVSDFVNDWKMFVHYQEEPFGSASAYAQYKVFQLAKQNHVTVLLDGQGADEILAGYPKYYKWYWQELFQKRGLFKSKELNAAKELGVEEKFTFKNVIAAIFPDIASVIVERQYLVNALRQEDLTKEFIRLQSKEAYYSTPPRFNLNSALYFNTCIHGLEELLRYADRNSMAHSREVRLPFLDPELVRFIFSLPPNFKIRHGWTKWILRQYMVKQLSNDIAWRKKKIGFEPPQKQWMQDARVREMVQEAKKKMVSEKILKPEILSRPVQASSSHEPGNYDWKYLAAASYL